MDAYDQVHIVSDLHLGGPRERQVMNQSRALAGVVDHLRGQPAGQRVALVLNGDLVDYLAAPDAAYLDPARAVAKLMSVVGDAAFAPVFEALARFVHTPDRTLVVALGNHDLELALPEAQRALVAALTQGDAAARGRVMLATDGAGYACEVGGDRVLCVHGNEGDPWNVVDHEALRRVAQAQNRAVAPDAWTPNAGTRLVVDVMNGVKARYPFVDLLKPETRSVPRVLAALPTDYSASITGFARAWARREYDGLRMGAGFLGDEAPRALSDEAALRDLLRVDPEARARTAVSSADPLARMADFAKGARPYGALDGELGLGGLTLDRLLGRDPVENLREALDAYARDDDTFEVGGRDEVFEALDERVAPEVRYLVAGHTHLARVLPRKRGRGLYLNSGTWIRLLRLTRAMLASTDTFAPCYKAFLGHTFEELEAVEGLVVQPRNVVSIERTATGSRAALRSAREASQQKPGAPPWDDVPSPHTA